MANGKDDIRVATGWPRHFKRRALQRELGPAGPLALIDLWCFAGEQRHSGVFKSPEEIEIVVDWPKRKQGQLVAALKATGWLDPDGVTLHDWQLVQPWAANRGARVASARANGARGGVVSARIRSSGIEADSKRTPSGVEPPSPSPSPSPSPQTPLPPAERGDGAAPPKAPRNPRALGTNPRGPTTTPTPADEERVRSRRSALAWADRARESAKGGDLKKASGSWAQALAFAAEGRMEPAELGAPPYAADPKAESAA